MPESPEARERRLAYNKEYYKEYTRKMAPEVRERRRLRAATWYKENKELANSRSKKWWKKNGERVRDAQRNYALLREYGITLEQKEEMYRNQKGLCDVCNQPLPEDFRKAAVDHNHVTGRVRALLHRDCNTVLGYEENNPGILLQALEYKKRWDSIEVSESV